MTDNKKIRALTKGNREIPFSLVIVFIVLSCIIIIAGYSYYSGYKETLTTHIKAELISICDLKVNQLVQWRKERLGDANYILNNILIADEINDFLKDPGHQAGKKKILSWLAHTKASYDYQEVAVFDSNGRVIFSTEKDIRQDESHIGLAKDSLARKKVAIGDLHKHQTSGEIDIGLFIPVLISKGREKHAIGGIMLLIDPYRFLYPMIQKWPVPSETAETLLVRQDGNDVLYLNELGHKKNTALSLRIPITNESLPASIAVRGKEGVVEGNDYRNIPVMAALRKVPDAGWYFIAKMDLKEAYLPVKSIVLVILVFVIVGILTAGLGIGLFWRNKMAAYYRGLYKAEEALRESQEIFQSFMEHSPIYVFFKDENIRSLRLSRNYETMLNRPLAELLGKSMDELFPSALAKSMVEDDKRIMKEGKTLNIEEELDGRFYHTIKFPIILEGKPRYLAGYTIDITERKQAEEGLKQYSAELEKSNKELQEALAKVRTLSGMLPICASCKKIRDDNGYWKQVESYVSEHTEAVFSHGICPECAKKAYAELEKLKKKNSEDRIQETE